WQRQPSEALSLARIFKMGKEGKYSLQIRVEFQNAFNRLFFAAPSTTNPAATVKRNGLVCANRTASFTSTDACTAGGGYVNQFTSNALTAGYGFVGTGGSSPRRGQFIAKFSF